MLVALSPKPLNPKHSTLNPSLPRSLMPAGDSPIQLRAVFLAWKALATGQCWEMWEFLKFCVCFFYMGVPPPHIHIHRYDLLISGTPVLEAFSIHSLPRERSLFRSRLPKPKLQGFSTYTVYPTWRVMGTE